jgi:Domain of unknown function (DUF4335)
MPIQRTYNLPSCTLRIEGIGTGGGSALSILTNFECRFHHTSVAIVGGRKLLDNLIKSSSRYTQLVLLGDRATVAEDAVRLEPSGLFLHQLHVQPTADDMLDPQPIEIQLSTVQLFDLVEGIDRLCIDPETLPDLNMNIAPAKAVVKSSDSGLKVMPAILGVVSLAIAAITLSLIPVPQPETKPQSQPITEPIEPQSNPQPPTP